MSDSTSSPARLLQGCWGATKSPNPVVAPVLWFRGPFPVTSLAEAQQGLLRTEDSPVVQGVPRVPAFCQELGISYTTLSILLFFVVTFKIFISLSQYSLLIEA